MNILQKQALIDLVDQVEIALHAVERARQGYSNYTENETLIMYKTARHNFFEYLEGL